MSLLTQIISTALLPLPVVNTELSAYTIIYICTGVKHIGPELLTHFLLFQKYGRLISNHEHYPFALFCWYLSAVFWSFLGAIIVTGKSYVE